MKSKRTILPREKKGLRYVKSRQSRETSLPRLAAYSTTALAALAFSPMADAQITNITDFNYGGLTNTTTPPSVLFTGTSKHFLTFTAGPFKGKFKGRLQTSAGRADFGDVNSSNFVGATRLALGAPLNGFAVTLNTATLASVNKNGGSVGMFLPPANGKTSGYLGFRVAKSGHTYYGWLKVQVTGNGDALPNSVSLVAATGHPGIFGAYDNKADAISTNFSAGQAVLVPEPGDAAFGLGLLAFGAAGVREMRKRKMWDKCTGSL